MRCIMGLIAFLSIFAVSAAACPFPYSEDSSLLDNYMEARIVAVCRAKHAVKPDNALPYGRTEFTLDDIIVPHAIVKGRKMFLAPRFIEPGEQKYLVAMEIYKGQIDAYAGNLVDPQGEIVRFVHGALQLKDKSPIGRGRYAVNFLHSPNKEVARSAYLEMGRMPYADLRKLAEKMQPEPLVKTLLDPGTQESNRSALAVLLGHCGKKEHVVILRKLIDDQILNRQALPFGYLKGYVLLDPDVGCKFAAHLIEHEEKPFLARISAHFTIRWLADERTDLCDRRKAAELISRSLNYPNMADWAIEDLRRWDRWEYSDTILALCHKPGFDTKIVRQAALRYALKCPTAPAKAFVQIERNANPDRVSEIEELLALEYPDDLPPKKK